jgi:hypothetical protein
MKRLIDKELFHLQQVQNQLRDEDQTRLDLERNAAENVERLQRLEASQEEMRASLAEIRAFLLQNNGGRATTAVAGAAAVVAADPAHLVK